MHEDLQKLSEREKETLRLLLAGHDAKSAANFLGLSVHTVNERLRDARRKLGVSSSREAARRLAEAEQNGPNLSVDRKLGVAGPAPRVEGNKQPDQRRAVGLPLAWLGGGVLVMSLIIAATVLLFAMQVGGGSQTPAVPVAAAASQPVSESAGSRSAREWLALLDDKRWDESWRSAGDFLKAQGSAAQWASTINSVRQPLGPVSSRALQRVTAIINPGGPTEIIQFQTSFANKGEATEIVTVAHESAGWKVTGYFIQ